MATDIKHLDEGRMIAAWVKEAPKEPGFYWYKSVFEGNTNQVVVAAFAVDPIYALPGEMEYRLIGGIFTADEMLEGAGEFWSERLMEPDGEEDDGKDEEQ